MRVIVTTSNATYPQRLSRAICGERCYYGITIEKNSSRHIPFLRNEYEIVEDTFSIEHLNVNMEEMKEKYVDIRQLKECDESMFLFVCCLVDALFENDTLWMAKASLE